MADTHNAPVLAIDTSVSVAVSVVGSDGRILVSHVVDAPRQQAEQLAPLVEDALREAGLTAQDLGSVVVGTGPAPFTGLRVGLVTARTIAFAAGVPAHGVCSLDALALGAVRSLALGAGDEVVVVGKQGSESISAADAVEYYRMPMIELMARMSLNVPRIYAKSR